MKTVILFGNWLDMKPILSKTWKVEKTKYQFSVLIFSIFPDKFSSPGQDNCQLYLHLTNFISTVY